MLTAFSNRPLPGSFGATSPAKESKGGLICRERLVFAGVALLYLHTAQEYARRGGVARRLRRSALRSHLGRITRRIGPVAARRRVRRPSPWGRPVWCPRRACGSRSRAVRP